MEELHPNIEDCSGRAKRFESDNIYHILKFGGVRLIKGDFESATKFYDQVIRMDPAWSAFAHYNIAYCTLHMIDMMNTSDVRSMTWNLHGVNLQPFKNNPCFLKYTSVHLVHRNDVKRV